MTEPARRSLRTPISRWTWVLPGLCFVLSGIGFVQLRWIDEVAKAQRERALGAIQAGVARFASAFDGEITRVHLAFETPSPSSDAAAVLRHRFTMWREMAPYPRLVSEVKLVEVPRAPGRFHFSARPGLSGQ